MRRKVPKPTAVEPSSTDIISQLANMFAASNEKLAVAIGGALTSRHVTAPLLRKSVQMDFTYAGGGAVTGGTASISGASDAWDIAFTRADGVISSAAVSTVGSAGWQLAFTRADGKLSVSASPN